MADRESLHPDLQEWARHVEDLEWSALLLDSDMRLVWVSPQLLEFIDADERTDLGYGEHIAAAFMREGWLRTVHPDSQIELFNRLAPFIVTDMAQRGRDPKDVLAEQFLPLLDAIEPKPIPSVLPLTFTYASHDPEMSDYDVDALLHLLYSQKGEFVGLVGLFYMGVRPNLLQLLARGDQNMYERMARLVEPKQREAAILFCDLHESVGLSRRLPSMGYFKLVRRLWTGIDGIIAEETGIVGKHAGDGASAFFLVSDLGSRSAAAAAALRASRRIHELGHEVFHEVMESECLMKIGVHFGANLYMGQLVPGGRLDVTALGDEVNECSRVQESTPHGETLASKALIEQLTPDDAASVGIDVEKLRFEPLGEVATATEKAKRDAGAVAVVPFS